MKKFATLAMTGFLACSILACGEDKECDEATEDCDNPSSSSSAGTVPTPPGSGPWTLSDLTGSGWTKTGTIEVGGTGAIGSFLDIDGTITATGAGDFKTWKVGEASAHANEIDLVYDGTNIFSITGCKASCSASYKSAISTSTNVQGFLPITSNIGPGTAACSIHSAVPGLPGSTIINNYVVAERSTYYIATSDGARAIILVGKKTGAEKVELHIGYLYAPSGCSN